MPKSRFIPDKPKIRKTYKRAGVVSTAERSLMEQIVLEQPREMSPKQVTAMATLFRRSKEQVKGIVEEAHEKFVAQADHYVDLHRQAVDAALDEGQFEVAAKGAQWYLERVSASGSRVIEQAPKAATGPTGSTINIGVKIGGVESTVTAIPVPTLEVTPVDTN